MAQESINKANKKEPLSDYDIRILALWNYFNENVNLFDLRKGYGNEQLSISSKVLSDNDIQIATDECSKNPTACPTLFKKLVTKIDDNIESLNLKKIGVEGLNSDSAFYKGTLTILGDAKKMNNLDFTLKTASHETLGHYLHFSNALEGLGYGSIYQTKYSNKNILGNTLTDEYNTNYYRNQPTEILARQAEAAFMRVYSDSLKPKVIIEKK